MQWIPVTNGSNEQAASRRSREPILSSTRRSTLMKFHAILQSHGKTATGIEVPEEVVAILGAGKRPPVRVTINGHTYRSTIAVMGGVYMLGVSAENRLGAGVAAGDELEVDLELDAAPREVSVPPDFAEALDRD